MNENCKKCNDLTAKLADAEREIKELRVDHVFLKSKEKLLADVMSQLAAQGERVERMESMLRDFRNSLEEYTVVGVVMLDVKYYMNRIDEALSTKPHE